MDFIHLLVAEPDREYVNRFTHYVRMSEFSKRFKVKSFLSPRSLEDYLANGMADDMLLISPDWLGQLPAVPERCAVVRLVEDFSAPQEEGEAVYKYQPLNQLLTQIEMIGNRNRRKNQRGHSAGDVGQGKVLAVYSAAGGSGKTTVAVNLAKQLALHGKRVFFFSLETVNALEFMFSAPSDDEFGELLYYLKNNSGSLPSKLNGYRKRHPAWGFDYIQPYSRIKDWESLTGEDTIRLLQAASGSCDYTVVDLPCAYDERIWKVLERSAQTWWLVTDNRQCLAKTCSIIAALQELYEAETNRLWEKCRFILNKYTGSLANDFHRKGIGIDGFLPYIPEWKALSRNEQVLESDIFGKYIGDLFHRLYANRHEVIGSGQSGVVSPT